MVAARRRPSTILSVVAVAVLAACSTAPDVEELSARTDPSDPSPVTSASASTGPGGTAGAADDPRAGPSTTVARTEDGRATVVEPDPSGLPSISDPDPAIVSGVLENGLEYHVRENDSPGGSVELRLAVDAGSAMEQEDQSGVAHFLEHMLFNGTEEFPENELIDVLRSFGSGFGADINAVTDYDETVYSLTVPSGDATVATGLDVLEQWLTSATLVEDDVIAERGIVLDEWRGAAASSTGRIYDAYTTLLLEGTPYDGRDPIGTAEAIAGMTSEPLRRFYDDWYRPDNAAVVVVGDIDAGEIVAAIEERFASAVARGDAPERPDLASEPSTDARVERLVDPDVPEGFVGFTLPAPSAGDVSGAPEAELQRDLYDQLAYQIVAERLSDDARRGDADFDRADVDGGDFVRRLTAPEVSVVADGDDLERAAGQLLDEFERVRRYGFTESEVDRAVAATRRSARSNYDGRETRQDRSYADEYVRHFLEGEPVPTADATFAYFGEALDRATPATVGHGLVERLEAIDGYLIVVAPAADDDVVPSVDALTALVADRRDRDVEPRADETAATGELMVPPDPIVEASAEPLVADGLTLVDPLLLTFPNGVRVALNINGIEEGVVRLAAASPGGLALVADADIPDADAAGPVMSNSGLADLDAVALERFLVGADVGLTAQIEPFVDRLEGAAAASDLETLLQLVHLTMTAPRIDPVAVEQYLDDELPFAEDPGLDAGYAEATAYRQARYDDPRFVLPTVASLETVEVAGIEDVVVQRFGDASDWAFSLSGDLDRDEAIRLARTYLGTLPGSGRVEEPGFVEPPPPEGIVTSVVDGGTGEQARLALYFTQAADPTREDTLLAAYVGEVVTMRLTDEIRERLGGSYSAFADVQTTGGPAPYADAYVSATAAPEALDTVAAAVLEQLRALAADGPTEAEFEAAREAVVRQTALFSNGEINEEVLRALVDPAVDGLEPYLLEGLIAQSIGRDDVREAIVAWMPVDEFIEVRTLPR